MKQQPSQNQQVYPASRAGRAAGQTILTGYKPGANRPQSNPPQPVNVQPVAKPPTTVDTGVISPPKEKPKVKAVPPEETFLLGFLGPLYSGDENAIIGNLYEPEHEFNKLVIEASSAYAERANAHNGYKSAKIKSSKASGGKVSLKTTVTYNDGETEDEEFYVAKNQSGAWKYYVE